MMRHPRFVLPFLLAFASLSLVACGDDDTGGDNDDGGGGSGATGGSGGSGGSGGAGTGGSGGSGGAGGGTQADIFQRLQQIPGAQVTEETSVIDGYRFFVIELDQPVDHADPAGQHFNQRISLYHHDEAAPTVLASSGYVLFDLTFDSQYLEEPTVLLGGNQISVEHRFFSPSRPEPADWTKLTIEQAAADHHRIVELFKPIYDAKWVSTGVSKGGMTSVYHRRFYPGDVDATVAYVAPLSFGVEDPRYIDFLNQVGDASCRQKLHDFEREVLLRREVMEQRMLDQAAQYNITYDQFGVDGTLESIVISFSFGFWQYYGLTSCQDIPAPAASDDDIWAFFSEIGAPYSSSDQYSLIFEPYYWQAFTQLGAPGSSTAHLDDLLTYDWDMADLLPSVDLEPTYDPASMQDINSWVTTEAERILFIYGENDPWSAGAFELGNAQDSYRFFEPGGTHGAAIVGLLPADQQASLAALEAWTGVTPTLPMSLTATPPNALPLRLRRILPAGPVP